MPIEKPELEIESDRRFQERLWTFQRLFWILMLVVAIAALAGATGAGGVLAQGTVSSNGASVDYPRIARWQRAEQLKISLPPTPATQSEILLGASFMQAFSISSMTPTPRSAKATSDGVLFVIERTPRAAGTVMMSLRPEQPMLPRKMNIRIEGDPVSFTAAVLP